MNMATESHIDSLVQSQGFTRWGWVPLERPLSIEFYRSWIEHGHHGEMIYLKDHLPAKEDPTLLCPQAQSALVMALDYIPHPEPGVPPLKTPVLARYARGKDYHHWLMDQLRLISESLKKLFPEDEFLPFSDSSPVLERDLAHRAGLGWFGKNTCLIDKRHGSFFLIGEIYTSLKAPQVVLNPSPDHCGRCTRCIDACPTGALSRTSKELIPERCISYWTIESRQTPPVELRYAVGEWLFGCDICQEVCPWNEKVFGGKVLSEDRTKPQALMDDLKFILSSTNKELERTFKGTPLSRSGGRGLKRNALLMVARLQLHELMPLVISAGETYPQLKELAEWTIKQLEYSE